MHPLRRAAKLSQRFSGCDLHNAVKGAYLRRVEVLLAAEASGAASACRSSSDMESIAEDARSAYGSCSSSVDDAGARSKHAPDSATEEGACITEVDLLVALCRVRFTRCAGVCVHHIAELVHGRCVRCTASLLVLYAFSQWGAVRADQAGCGYCAYRPGALATQRRKGTCAVAGEPSERARDIAVRCRLRRAARFGPAEWLQLGHAGSRSAGCTGCDARNGRSDPCLLLRWCHVRGCKM